LVSAKIEKVFREEGITEKRVEEAKTEINLRKGWSESFNLFSAYIKRKE